VFTLAQRRSWLLSDVLFALLAFYAALTHKRFLFLAGIIVCPMLSVELANHVFSPYDPRKDKRWLNVTIMAAFYLFRDLPHPALGQFACSRGAVLPRCCAARSE
jgi:hypothetical protein